MRTKEEIETLLKNCKLDDRFTYPIEESPLWEKAEKKFDIRLDLVFTKQDMDDFRHGLDNQKYTVRVVNRPETDPRKKKLKHPVQPLYEDECGTTRFKGNAIVRHLIDNGPFDMNSIAMGDFSPEDREQFYQLIGYSLSGFGELSHVSDSTYKRAADQKVIKLGLKKVKKDK